MQCSIGCGGQACKYDNPSYWSDDQQAIKGLYSSWYAYLFYLSSCDSMAIVFHVNYFSKITSYFLLTSHVAVVGLTSVDYFLIYSPLTFFSCCFRVTDHLLAMSRPSTAIIEKYNIIDQFRRYRKVFQQLPGKEQTATEEMRIIKCSCLCLCVCVFVSRNGIKTVINLQIPGEHANCGNPLEPESGFSYRPEVFMEKNSMYFTQ